MRLMQAFDESMPDNSGECFDSMWMQYTISHWNEIASLNKMEMEAEWLDAVSGFKAGWQQAEYDVWQIQQQRKEFAAHAKIAADKAAQYARMAKLDAMNVTIHELDSQQIVQTLFDVDSEYTGVVYWQLEPAVMSKPATVYENGMAIAHGSIDLKQKFYFYSFKVYPQADTPIKVSGGYDTFMEALEECQIYMAIQAMLGDS